jgi:hypothetical protein
MLELPAGAPLGLTWFASWAAISAALAFVNRQVGDEDGQLEKEVERGSVQAMDRLNTNMQLELRLLAERPVNDRTQLSRLYRWVSDAWNPRARFDRFQQLGRLGRVFCALHFIAALAAGALWWAVQDGRHVISWIDAAAFLVLLLPILACISYRIWAHMVLSKWLSHV